MSSDSPKTPATLATCTTGTTRACEVPSSAHGNPPNRRDRIHSIATQVTGNVQTPATPNRRMARPVSQDAVPMKTPRYAHSSAPTGSAIHAEKPPYIAMTPTTQ